MSATREQPRLGPRPVVHEPPVDAQELWFAVHKGDWTSLAVLPAEPGCPTLPVARVLAEVTALHRGKPPLVLTGETLDLAGSANLVTQLRLHHATDPEDTVLVPLGPLSAFPAGVAVARAADAALLVVELGRTHLRAAREAVELVGRDKFLGYVVLERRE